MSFTCGNRRYKTDTRKGYPHGPGRPLGSVFDTALVTNTDDGGTLWLEYVTEPKTGAEVFWLMWYHRSGGPAIRASGVLTRDGLKEISRKLSAFIEVP
jgi:hypothetical protein